MAMTTLLDVDIYVLGLPWDRAPKFTSVEFVAKCFKCPNGSKHARRVVVSILDFRMPKRKEFELFETPIATMPCLAYP